MSDRTGTNTPPTNVAGPNPAIPTAFTPLLQVRRSRFRWIGWGLLAVVAIAGAAGWWYMHRHWMADASLTMYGTNVVWEIDRRCWEKGGRTIVTMGHTVHASDGSLMTYLGDLRNVVSLDLSKTWDAGDRDMAVVGRLERLEYLSLNQGPFAPHAEAQRFGDSTLRHLHGLKHLRELDLGNAVITDGGLAALKNLPSLETIDLSATGIGDEGLMRLKDLPNLKVVYIEHTRITPAGMAAFLKVRPTVELNNGYNPAAQRDFLR